MCKHTLPASASARPGESGRARTKRLDLPLQAGPLLLALLALLSACGAGGGPADAGRWSAGVRLGGYEAIRLSPLTGRPDPALNSTLRLQLETAGGGAEALRIGIEDPEGGPVLIELRYSGASLDAQGAEFGRLLGPQDRVLSASFLGRPGLAALGQAPLGARATGPLSGHFATLRFAPGTARRISGIGDAHHNPAGVGGVKQLLPNFTLGAGLPGQSAQAGFSAAWHIADGDQNSEVNIADITAIGLHFGKLVSADWRALVADYDDNGEVNLADLTPIGLYYGEGTDGYTIEASDNTAGAPQTEVASPAWSAAIAPEDPDNPGGTALYDVFSHWSVLIDEVSDFSYSELSALDQNLDGVVRLWATPQRGGADGASASLDVGLVAGIPTAVLVANPVSGAAPLDVAFDASGSTDDVGITAYRFDFTDDGSWDQDSAADSANFQYAAPGTYTCRLEVEDGDGNTAQATAQAVASAPDAPPTAALSANPLSGPAPLDVAFNAALSTDDGSIVAYRFDFTDDGTFDQDSAAAVANFSYANPGTYTCRLEVEDDGGQTAQTTVGIAATGGGGILTYTGRVGQLFEPVPLNDPNGPWAHSNPLQGVEFAFYEDDPSSTPLGVATSAANGYFTIQGLPAIPGMGIVAPTGPPPSGDIWGPPQQHFLIPFSESVPSPDDPPNGLGQNGQTFTDQNFKAP